VALPCMAEVSHPRQPARGQAAGASWGPSPSRLTPTRGAYFPAWYPPRLRGSVAVCNAFPRPAHGRSSLCYPGPARRGLRATASTAASGRVVRSSGPYGPLHRRPRLRHYARRRGAASAASRPTQSSRTNGQIGMPVCSAARGPVRAAAETAPPLDCPRERLGCQAAFLPPIGAVTRSNSCGALPHLVAPHGAPMCSRLRPTPVSASPRPSTADGAVGLARWPLPCLASHGGFQLHRGWHRRPPWWFAPIRLGTLASDWRLGTSRGCSSHVALAPGKLPPALDASTQGLASILVVRCAAMAPPWRCAVLPVCGRRSQALRVQHGHAHA
jgi:hypothetical protein